jgi:hypothetical protein
MFLLCNTHPQLHTLLDQSIERKINRQNHAKPTTPMEYESSNDGLPIKKSKATVTKRTVLGNNQIGVTAPTKTVSKENKRDTARKENVVPVVKVPSSLAESDTVPDAKVFIPGGGGVTLGDITEEAIAKHITDTACMGMEISADDAALLHGATLFT